MFERYLISDVVGANLSIGYGGLTHDPIMKTAVILAIEAITPPEVCNSFMHCNTTAQTKTVDNNYAVVSIDDLYIAMALKRSNSGAAMLSIPVTEAIRIPTWQEVVQVQTMAERAAIYAGELMPTIDWSCFDALKERLLEGGKRYFDNVMNGLQELKIDLQNPLQILMAIRTMGAVEIENRWGIGELPKDNTQTYKPIYPTDTFKDYERYKVNVRRYFSGFGAEVDREQRVIVGSTDIHEYAMLLAVEALRELGINPIVAGVSVDPDEFADLALETNASAILLSTHNGMALTYSENLLRELKQRSLNIPVGIGGTLNQALDGEPEPLDVTDKLAEMGLVVCNQINDLLGVVRKTPPVLLNA
jgi:methylmalonyl-CoA mutase cobalamin-binding subunit